MLPRLWVASTKPEAALDRLAQLLRGAEDYVPLLSRSRSDLVDPVPGDVACRFVDVVADVVERARELVHVVAVEGRHERAVEQVDELARQPVALVLQLLDVAEETAVLWKLLEQPDEQARDLDRVPRGAAVENEEFALLGDE